MADEKLKNVIWYLSSIAPPLKMGAVQLMKAILYAELHSMIYRHKAIIGDNFVKAQRGPVPKGWKEARRELEAEGKIRVEHHQGEHEQDKYFCLVPPPDGEASPLSRDERETLRGVAGVLCDRYSLDAISDITHNEAWERAEKGGYVPIASYARVRGRKPSPELDAALAAQTANIDWGKVDELLA